MTSRTATTTTTKHTSLFRRVFAPKSKSDVSNTGTITRSFQTYGGVYTSFRKTLVGSKSTRATKSKSYHKRTLSNDSMTTALTAMTCDSMTLGDDEEMMMLSSHSPSVSFDQRDEEEEGNMSFRLIRQPSCRHLVCDLDIIEDSDDYEDEEEVATPSSIEWKSSGSHNHHDDSPLIALKSQSLRLIDPINYPELELSDDEVLHKVLMKASKTLPRSSGNFASLHVMINNERLKNQIAPLQRSVAFDELARQHAKKMADQQTLHHPTSPFDELLLEDTVIERIGSNVSCIAGDLVHMHHCMMKSAVADRNNILDRRYTDMGIGTYKSSDGKLYVCELFATSTKTKTQQ